MTEAEREEWRRYDVPIDLDSPIDSRAIVLRLVPAGARVLELGCSAGLMTEVLHERGHRVVGVEVDPEPARIARASTEALFVGDLDTVEVTEWLSSLEDPSFDVILAADVLEHLRDPHRALGRVLDHLRPGGTVILSIPNAAHADIRLGLLQGHLDYRDSGLLDRTHIHLFTYHSLVRLVERSGLAVVGWHRCVRPLGETELDLHPDMYRFGQRILAADPDADTYQWILECRRADEADGVPDPLRPAGAAESVHAPDPVVAAVVDLMARADAPPPPPASRVDDARRVVAAVRRRLGRVAERVRRG